MRRRATLRRSRNILGFTTVDDYSQSGSTLSWSTTNGSWTADIGGMDGKLAAQVAQSGIVTLELADLHGEMEAQARKEKNEIAAGVQWEENELKEHQLSLNRAPAQHPATKGGATKNAPSAPTITPTSACTLSTSDLPVRLNRADRNSAQGNFFEGVMTSGASSDATDDAVQANIVAAGYGH